jgi:hypothetical protein
MANSCSSSYQEQWDIDHVGNLNDFISFCDSIYTWDEGLSVPDDIMDLEEYPPLPVMPMILSRVPQFAMGMGVRKMFL